MYDLYKNETIKERKLDNPIFTNIEVTDDLKDKISLMKSKSDKHLMSKTQYLMSIGKNKNAYD